MSNKKKIILPSEKPFWIKTKKFLIEEFKREQRIHLLEFIETIQESDKEEDQKFLAKLKEKDQK